MSYKYNRLQPHTEEKKSTPKRKEFDVNTAFSQKKLNRHVLTGIIGALFGNKIIAVIYLYHQYKLHLLLNGKNKEKEGKEHSYYIRLCILRELTTISICFRLFISIIFIIGLANAMNNLATIYPIS